jgi:hypothetical protein
VLRRKGVRTIILRDYDGIVEVNHPGGNQWDGRRGERDLVQWLLGALATYIPSPRVQSHSSVSEFLIEVTVVANSRPVTRASKNAANTSVIYLSH